MGTIRQMTSTSRGHCAAAAISSLPVPHRHPAQGSTGTGGCTKGAHVFCCVQVLYGGCKHTVSEGVIGAKPLKLINYLKNLSSQQRNMLGITAVALVCPVSGNLV